MIPIVPSRTNSYTGSPLDRAMDKREDDAWIETALAQPETLFAPVWRARNLMRRTEDGALHAAYPGGNAAAQLRDHAGALVFLGLRDGTPVFAVDVGALQEPLTLLPPCIGEFTDLRAVPGLLSADDAAILAHARGMMNWRARHRFCGLCGAACVPQRGGNVMRCAGCDVQHFPRTDPAVIMLITIGDRALLGRSHRFATTTTYSTLAGFVEPGESLEEAVAREVFEESGIRVGRVAYHSSQPWPFPGSIMLGFYGEALSEAITVDPTELLDASWFTRAQLRNPGEHGFHLPRIDSIARHLIEDWVAAG